MVRNVAPTIVLAIRLVAVEQSDAEIAAFQRLDFGQYPNQRTSAHRKSNDEHQQHSDSEVLRERRMDAGVHHRTRIPIPIAMTGEAQRQGQLAAAINPRPIAMKVASTLVR